MNVTGSSSINMPCQGTTSQEQALSRRQLWGSRGGALWDLYGIAVPFLIMYNTLAPAGTWAAHSHTRHHGLASFKELYTIIKKIKIKNLRKQQAARNLPKFCQKVAKKLPESCQKVTRKLSEICLKVARKLPEINQKVAIKMPETSKFNICDESSNCCT